MSRRPTKRRRLRKWMRTRTKRRPGRHAAEPTTTPCWPTSRPKFPRPAMPMQRGAGHARPNVFLDGGNADRSAAIYFGNDSMGSPAGLQSWAPGAEPILVAPVEEPGVQLSALESPSADTSRRRDDHRQGQQPGLKSRAATRARRQAARAGREMSRRCDLFRGARRAVQRPAGRCAGG